MLSLDFSRMFSETALGFQYVSNIFLVNTSGLE